MEKREESKIKPWGDHKERETDREQNERWRRKSRWETRENSRREGGCRDERERQNEGGETVR